MERMNIDGSVKTVILPKNLEIIGKSSFACCYDLTDIIIPDSVTSIEWVAFFYCSSLTTVNYRGTQEQWKTIGIDGYGNEDLTNATINYNYTGK